MGSTGGFSGSTGGFTGSTGGFTGSTGGLGVTAIRSADLGGTGSSTTASLSSSSSNRPAGLGFVAVPGVTGGVGVTGVTGGTTATGGLGFSSSSSSKMFPVLAGVAGGVTAAAGVTGLGVTAERTGRRLAGAVDRHRLEHIGQPLLLGQHDRVGRELGGEVGDLPVGELDAQRLAQSLAQAVLPARGQVVEEFLDAPDDARPPRLSVPWSRWSDR